jgi:superfamily II DNA or RNA helicase
VQIRCGSGLQVDACVKGSQNYDVSIGYDSGVLRMLCTCAYFDSDGPCKHLWATVLAAESNGFLTALAGRRILKFDYSGVEQDDDFDDGEDEIEEFTLDYADEYTPRPKSSPPPKVQPIPKPPPVPQWRRQIEDVSRIFQPVAASSTAFPSKRQVLYIIDVGASLTAGSLVLSVETRDRKMNGEWSRLTPLNIKRNQLVQAPLAEDRELLASLAGPKQFYGWGYSDGFEAMASQTVLSAPLAPKVIRMAVGTGRCYMRLRDKPDDLLPLAWDDGGPWEFALEMRQDGDKSWVTRGVLRRGEERLELSTVMLIVQGGLVFTRERVALLAEVTRHEWLQHLQRSGEIRAPERDGHELLAALLNSPNVPALEVPEDLRYEEVMVTPRPALHIGGTRSLSTSRLRAQLSFDYQGRLVPHGNATSGFYDPESRRFLRRDAEAEKNAENLLTEVGVKFQPATYYDKDPAWEMAPTKLPRIVRALVEAGWHIEAEGKVFRRPGAFRMEVSSGVDWFELHGEVSYGETTARLPELLAAVRRGETMVRLGDGTYGMLPEEWLARVAPLAGLGVAGEGHVRFRRSQAGLLDALLATQPEAQFDETFARLRDELRKFEGVGAAEQPAGFAGQLREYQRDGLGWMHFLRRYSFGGCLADDMGVGKTAQVLALLETRRELRAAGEVTRPSLVVVPRSLVFNWKEEAARFTPQLRVLDYTGVAREGMEFDGHDVVLTTYGTVRRDALRLKDVEFDYVVLDEAQAVKNATTESSKAVRLLRGEHRLALSGTPIENHLGELWTLFEFLNPGMLGAASVFKLAGSVSRNADDDTRRLLAHALRPFILRRTKGQVARELPPKTEQTIYCEMKPPQRKLYDELREHYRNSLLQRIATQGMAKSKIQVLEALLRLRQAACHPGLIDDKRIGDPSAKLDVLLAQLREVLEEGHKALIFSQFTSLLKIVRERLDADGVVYEYLDGATTDRQSCVERFQNESDCSVFLISLKAGGLGLNLTAAEYVFLLDPWWNPAVEAQAVDRAHRIGQTRQVFAYRLIARDTVEEKVLELQAGKRDLAAAIINQDNSVIRSLSREDLELLLS